MPLETLRQLQSLRELRLSRSRLALSHADQAAQQAAERRRDAQAGVASLQHRLESHDQRVAHELSAQWPRWRTLAQGHRDALADLHERAEYALIDEQQSESAALRDLEVTRQSCRRAQLHAEALADLVSAAGAARLRTLERGTERDGEDLRWPRTRC